MKNLLTAPHLIFAGTYNQLGLEICLHLGCLDFPLKLNLKAIVESEFSSKTASLIQICQICTAATIKTIVYPNEKIRFSKLDSSSTEIKTCYVAITVDYFIVIAFDETQPGLYKGELIAILAKN